MRGMRCFVALLCALAASGQIHFDPYRGPAPVAVLIETNPWLMVIGSDTPMVVIYGDGSVVYLQRSPHGSGSYLQKKLTPSELETAKQKLAGFGDYSHVRSSYNLAPNMTDLPETRIYLQFNGQALTTRVYGLTVADTELPGVKVLRGGKNGDSLPEPVRNLHRYLTTLHFEDATPWEPEYIEVMVWPYEYAPDKSIHWPKDWPGLESSNAIKRGDAYSIFLPSLELRRLRAFLNTRREKGAVEIGGKKWAVDFRYVFPSEPVWAKAFMKTN